MTVNGDPAQYEYKDPLADVNMGPNTTIGNHQSYKGKYLTALKDADEGELKIMIPSDAVVQVCTVFWQKLCQIHLDIYT